MFRCYNPPLPSRSVCCCILFHQSSSFVFCSIYWLYYFMKLELIVFINRQKWKPRIREKKSGFAPQPNQRPILCEKNVIIKRNTPYWFLTTLFFKIPFVYDFTCIFQMYPYENVFWIMMLSAKIWKIDRKFSNFKKLD